MMDIILQGTITPDTTSPLATSPMDIPNERDTKSKYLEGGPRTQRLPRMLVPASEGSAERAWSAYFPASGFRGKLRRLARDVFFNLYGKGWGIDAHRYLTIGGVKGSDSEPSFDLAKARTLRQNVPFISLFGATSDMGCSWVNGKIGVSPAVPYAPLQPQVINGVRTDDLARSTEELRYLSEDALNDLTARTGAERKSAALRRDLKAEKQKHSAAKRAKDAEAVTAAEESIASIEADIEAFSSLSGKDVSVQMPLDGYEAIPPGVALQQRITLTGVTEAEAGLLFLALEAFAGNPYLGAHSSQGCGIVHGRWSVRLRSGFGKPYENVGEVVTTPFEGAELNGEALRSLVEKCQAAFHESVKAMGDSPVEAVIQG